MSYLQSVQELNGRDHWVYCHYAYFGVPYSGPRIAVIHNAYALLLGVVSKYCLQFLEDTEQAEVLLLWNEINHVTIQEYSTTQCLIY